MVAKFTRGQREKFIAEISFGLNWDDKDMKSIRIRKGQELFYDGEIAVVENGVGHISGRCMGLKSAINMMGWLKPVNNIEVSKVAKAPVTVSDSLFEGNDYDPRLGGNLDAFMRKNNGPKREIIKEEDLIVKKIPSINKKKESVRKGKLEVAGDQVEVSKERLLVSSTTIRAQSSKRDIEIVKADEMGADSTLPLKGQKKAIKSEKKKAFIVDDTTPRQIRDDMTQDEVRRITKVVNADESQDAKIVKKIDRSKVEVKEVEGITLKKIPSPKEVKYNKVISPSGMTIKTTVGSGSGFSAGDQGGVVVGVSKVAKGKAAELAKDLLEEATPPTEEEKKEAARKLAEREKRAKARAVSRKKASATTQKLMEKGKGSVTDDKSEKSKKSKKSKKAKKSEIVEKLDINKVPDLVKEVKPDEDLTKVSTSDATTDYLLILPDNWNKLHWVKKEKFIKEINDIYFIKFILSMESTKAVKNACNERLEELGQKEPAG